VYAGRKGGVEVAERNVPAASTVASRIVYLMEGLSEQDKRYILSVTKELVSHSPKGPPKEEE